MKLGISESILLILTLPAHRSGNESHKILGDKVMDLLNEYKDSEKGKGKEYNMAMIGAIYSAARLFSVERDRIGESWKAVENIKIRRERLLELCRNLSPFTTGNYWIKTLALLSAGGISFTFIFPQNYQNAGWFIGLLIGFLIVFEIISKIGEHYVSEWIEKQVPIEKSNKWIEQSITEYKNILKHFIDEAVDINLRYYPDEKEIYGYDITDKSKIEELKEYLVNKHFHEFHD